jgi:AcrR family transcriptional regulator
MVDAENKGDGGRLGERGPADHRTRLKLLEEAESLFRHYGYTKTTVADLSRSIGVSPAYVYRFFDSKQAIGEAVVAKTLGHISSSLLAIESEALSASERLRRVYRTMVAQGFDLYFSERKLHDIVVAAIDGHWGSVQGYLDNLDALVRRIVVAGRESGEFERKTPLDDLCAAISCTLRPFGHPILLEQTDRVSLQADAEQVANLVLRSLAP